MLDVLHRIVQEVNAARGIAQALQIVVDRVAEAMGTDVCSAYLVEGDDVRRLILTATRGLNASAVGHVRLGLEEGLVGLVAEREEPVNLDEADRHHRYRYFAETGEEHFHSFLGVPVIHYRRLMGVLVVQHRRRRRFDDAEVAFLVTVAAQLAGAIAHARATGDMEDLRLHGARGRNLPLMGVAGATGVAIGQARVVYTVDELAEVPDRQPDDIEREQAQFHAAVEAVRADIQDLAQVMSSSLPASELALFDVYLRILDGQSLVSDTLRRIGEGNWAAGAVRDAIANYARRFEEMDDPYLRERASDIRDIGRRLLMKLATASGDRRPMAEATVLVGQEVNASQLAEVDRDKLAGVVSATGSHNSHVAILARALGVPAVMGVSDLRTAAVDGKNIIVDGYSGRIYLEPSETVLDEYHRLFREEAEFSEGLRPLLGLASETADGHRVRLYVNTGLISDIESSRHVGCDGVGLHRTEFPFMIRERFPGEDEQYRIYRELLEAFAPLPATLRTLDVGGDKGLPYFPIRDENPFLGWRGIRVTLDHPEIFMTQIRAMLRASQGLGNLRIMFPMVSRLEEVDQAVRLVRRARDELAEEGVDVPLPPLGAMVEVPAAVYQADSLAQRLDFLSVGSNDLAQYILAVDRNNPRVADLYDELHPAVLRAVKSVAEAGRRWGKPVTVCGGMAGSAGTALLLLGMGLDGLSMSSTGLLRVKAVVRSFTLVEAEELLERALELEYPDQIRALIRETLEARGLGGLIRAGK